MIETCSHDNNHQEDEQKFHDLDSLSPGRWFSVIKVCSSCDKNIETYYSKKEPEDCEEYNYFISGLIIE